MSCPSVRADVILCHRFDRSGTEEEVRTLILGASWYTFFVEITSDLGIYLTGVHVIHTIIIQHKNTTTMSYLLLSIISLALFMKEYDQLKQAKDYIFLDVC
jgi:hypothetical protein